MPNGVACLLTAQRHLSSSCSSRQTGCTRVPALTRNWHLGYSACLTLCLCVPTRTASITPLAHAIMCSTMSSQHLRTSTGREHSRCSHPHAPTTHHKRLSCKSTQVASVSLSSPPRPAGLTCTAVCASSGSPTMVSGPCQAAYHSSQTFALCEC